MTTNRVFRWWKRLLVAGVCAAGALTADASDARADECFVSTTGVDFQSGWPFRPGSLDAPLRTVNRALALGSLTCNPITLLDGTYPERLQIRGRNEFPSVPLLIRAQHRYDPEAPSGGAILDGGQAPTNDSPVQAVISIEDSSYITIEGLRIRQDASLFQDEALCNSSSSKCNSGGIVIRNNAYTAQGASSHDIVIDGCELAFIYPSTLLRDGARAYHAVPLSVFSDRDGVTPAGTPDPTEATHHVQIIRNHIHDTAHNNAIWGLPAINVSTNVEDVLVEGNIIERVTAPPGTYQEGTPAIVVRGERFAAQNPLPSEVVQASARARRVVVRLNMIFGTHAADGYQQAVYVQSANGVLIERNLASGTFRGVQVVTEWASDSWPANAISQAHQIWIRDNLIVDTQVAIDLGIQGTYAPIRDVYVTHNTIRATNARTDVAPASVRPAVILRPGIDGDSRFSNNIVDITWPAGQAAFPNQAGGRATDFLLQLGTFDQKTAMRLDHNLWHVASYPGDFRESLFWCTPGEPYCHDFVTYRDIDGGALAEDPQFIAAPSKHAGRLSAGSPVIDHGGGAPPGWLSPDPFYSGFYSNFGEYSSASFPETDYFGNPRLNGSAVDIGMEEYGG